MQKRSCWLAPEGASIPSNFAPKPLVGKIKGKPANSHLPGKWPLKQCVYVCTALPHIVYAKLSYHNCHYDNTKTRDQKQCERKHSRKPFSRQNIDNFSAILLRKTDKP